MQIITPQSPNWHEITKNTLQAGGVVIHPTDTAYGIAVDATNKRAINKVFALKKRGNKPLIMVVRGKKQAAEYCHLNKTAITLIDELFPGALTVVVKKKDLLPSELTCNTAKVGIRQPDHPVIHTISRHFDHPFTSTSANLSGAPTTYTIKDALAQLDNNVIDLVIDAGKLEEKPTSTIVDTTTNPLHIIREGPISSKIIHQILTSS